MSETVKGLNKALRKIQRLSDGPKLIKNAADESILFLQSQIPDYPPQRPTTYRRTNLLGNSLTSARGANQGLSRVEGIGKSIRMIIGTAVNYAKYVIDEKEQAWMHKGHWWTIQPVIREKLGGVLNIFQKKYDEAMKK